MTGLYVWKKHKNAERWSGRLPGDPRTRGPRQGWLSGSPLSHRHTGCQGSQRPRNINGSKQNWSPKACYLEPKMMERAVATYHSLTPVKHNRKTNPHIQCRHHTGGRTQPNPPAHTGVPSEKAQWKSALPPLPSQGMVSTEAWGGRVPHSCPHSAVACSPSPNDCQQRPRGKPELEPQTSINKGYPPFPAWSTTRNDLLKAKS